MDRKPVWINGRKVYVLPWARVWDVLMALPADDFRAVWTARAYLVDADGTRVSPNEIVYSGQKISVCRNSRDSDGIGARPIVSTGSENRESGPERCPEHP
ncbi:MAG: hypothetical protein ACXW4S_11735 [Candidatus Deferrimicrobiaceae bacterium]